MNGVLFERWFEKTLLKLLPQKHDIITDNASFHKKEVLYQIAKKYLQALIFFAAVFTEINITKHTWSPLKRNIASLIHRYSSVSEARNSALQGK